MKRISRTIDDIEKLHHEYRLLHNDLSHIHSHFTGMHKEMEKIHNDYKNLHGDMKLRHHEYEKMSESLKKVIRNMKILEGITAASLILVFLKFFV